jgi:hypothetical protein
VSLAAFIADQRTGYQARPPDLGCHRLPNRTQRADIDHRKHADHSAVVGPVLRSGHFVDRLLTHLSIAEAVRDPSSMMPGECEVEAVWRALSRWRRRWSG